MLTKIILLGSILYLIMYGCIYTSYITYNLLSIFGLNCEYKIKDIEGTEFAHQYVECEGYNLFLNPLKEYGPSEDSIPPNEKPQWGKLFNPITNEFVEVF